MERINRPEEKGMPLMERLLTEGYAYHYPRRGEIRQGTVISIEPDRIIVDIGAKREGIVPNIDLEKLGKETVAEIDVGDVVPVYVIKPEDSEGNVIVSISIARLYHDWSDAKELFTSGEIYEGEIIGFNKGGLIVPFGRIKGFVPASQLIDMPRGLSPDEKMAKLKDYIGRRLSLKVIEVDPYRRRLIFSERAAKEKRKEKLMEGLVEGEIRRGVVRRLCEFGAFVDIGGAEGLVHISELSWQRVKHPSEVINVGDEVDVYILRLDYEKKRIGLSIKRLKPDPWSLVNGKYHIGQIVKGVITNVVDFGAFARIEPGVEGLIHISELSDGEFDHPCEVVEEGEELTLRIIEIDAERRRIGFSLRNVPPPEEATGAIKDEETLPEGLWISLAEDAERG
jgi:small subunit ribosomal protein S1